MLSKEEFCSGNFYSVTLKTFSSLIKKECDEFKNILTSSYAISNNLMSVCLSLCEQTDEQFVLGKCIIWKDTKQWPHTLPCVASRVYKHPSARADIHTQDLLVSSKPDTMCHRSNYYGGLGCGCGGSGGLGFGRGCGCGGFRRLSFGSGFGGYGCGSGFGSLGSGCCHRPLFFRRCGFSSFYWTLALVTQHLLPWVDST